MAGLVPAIHATSKRYGPPGQTREWRRLALLDRLRIERRAGAAGDDQRRAAKEKLVDAVVGAILGQLLDVEHLAHGEPHGRDHHPVPGLVDFLGLVRPHLDAPVSEQMAAISLSWHQ